VKLSRELKVGILATTALIGLIWGMNYLKGMDMFSSTNKYYAIYYQVDGLIPSSRVVLNGVKIGQVQKINFLKDRSGRILATLQVDKDIFIGNKSVIKIVSSDFLGGRIVTIDLDLNSPAAQDGDTLRSEALSTFSEQVTPIANKAEQLIISLDSLARAVRQVFSDETAYNLNQALVSIKQTSNSLDRMVDPDKGKLALILSNVESITDNIKNNNEELSNIMANISTLTDSLTKANITQTISEAGRALGQTADVMEKINNGEGTMGMLINNDSLYNALTSSSENLDKLLIDFKEHPKKYVQVSMFGGKYKEPKK
jgi:phospholipid/cholesterol/gamma-HCH transport system substrate-binding protein